MGRARELRELKAEWHRSELGELRVALVLGEPGLGKTRLAAELLPGKDELAIGLVARSSRLRRMPSLSRWAEALGRYMGGLDAEGMCRACGSGLGDLPALLRSAEIAQDAPPCPERPRHRLVERVVDLLAKVSADRPVVMVLDDAHHGDDALWEMLLLLSQDHPCARLFVLATARPGELVGHRVATEVLFALEQQAVVREIQLRPLTREDIRELATAIIRQDTVPPALVDWLMARSRGNPRFAVGLLETLVNKGVDLHAPELCGVPEGLARWVRAEVTRLDPSTQTLLELLAVVGDLVDPNDLAQIACRPVEEVALTLERLVRSGMVVEQEHDRSLGYAVAHPFIREMLYACIGGAKRRVLHRRAAGTLLGSGRAEAAALHFVRSARVGDSEAITALIEEARQAEQRGSHAMVWSIVPTLLDLLPSGDNRWLDVFDARSWQPDPSLTYRAKHYTGAEIAAMRRMEQLLARAGNVQHRASVRLWLAGFLVYGRGDLNAGEHECRQALGLWRRAGCEQESRMAAIELAKMRGWAGDLPGQELAARQVLREAEKARDQRGIVGALGALGLGLAWQGRFTEAEDVFVRSVELASATAPSSLMSQGLMSQGLMSQGLMSQGLMSQGLALLAGFDACQGHMVSARARWAQATRSSPHHDPTIWECGALIALLTGDLATVHLHARQAAAHNPKAQPPLPAWVGAMAAMAAAERGRITVARRDLDGTADACQSRDLGLFSPFSCWAEGVVAWAEHRLAAATAVLQKAVDHYSSMRASALVGFVLADLVEVAVAAGDCDTATWAATQAEDIARRTSAPSYQALQQFAAAWALLGRGCHDEAAQAALRAADGLGSCGYALLAARAHVAYANAVQRCDRSAAADALRQAAVGFDACGAVLRREQAHKLLTPLGSDGRRATDAVCGPDSLTRREREVAELAARGYTARQMADRLSIGVRTVETHLARIYPKLGVASKQELVHRGAEFGLAP